MFSGGLQAPGGAAFPGLLSFPAGVPGFSSSAAPAALSGLHNPAVQSALLQVLMTYRTHLISLQQIRLILLQIFMRITH